MKYRDTERFWAVFNVFRGLDLISAKTAARFLALYGKMARE